MSRGVHEPSGVQTDDDTQAYPPEEHRHAADGEKHDGQKRNWNPVILVQLDVEIIFGKVWSVLGDQCVIVGIAAVEEHPADVRPPGSIVRSVWIAFLV